jgi:hypothetical protein
MYTGRAPPHPTSKEVVPTEPPLGKPIRIIGNKPWNTIDPMARVDFLRVYTVEHNVKVEDFGQVDQEDEWKLMSQFNSHWGTSEQEDLPAPARYPRFYDGNTYGCALGEGSTPRQPTGGDVTRIGGRLPAVAPPPPAPAPPRPIRNQPGSRYGWGQNIVNPGIAGPAVGLPPSGGSGSSSSSAQSRTSDSSGYVTHNESTYPGPQFDEDELHSTHRSSHQGKGKGRQRW